MELNATTGLSSVNDACRTNEYVSGSIGFCTMWGRGDVQSIIKRCSCFIQLTQLEIGTPSLMSTFSSTEDHALNCSVQFIWLWSITDWHYWWRLLTPVVRELINLIENINCLSGTQMAMPIPWDHGVPRYSNRGHSIYYWLGKRSSDV